MFFRCEPVTFLNSLFPNLSICCYLLQWVLTLFGKKKKLSQSRQERLQLEFSSCYILILSVKHGDIDYFPTWLIGILLAYQVIMLVCSYSWISAHGSRKPSREQSKTCRKMQQQLYNVNKQLSVGKFASDCIFFVNVGWSQSSFDSLVDDFLISHLW